ncbi:hypothetical protein BKA65DRAFT_548649 [Rhexocercosporidium sp. MPI-PUGE-AT-0058]|nr:hypothetical protein BKA65DRAFT_548649 [Rhexocercosporidium sp. MPI-PUGE-AT-0058]
MTETDAHEPTVLVTGFGQFLDIKTNPSWEIASLLPTSINGVRVIVHPDPLKAEYHSLLEVHRILEEHQPDVVIHMGLAADRDYFALEKSAERDGYHEIPDEKRKVFTRAETKKVWGKSPTRLESTLDIEDILRLWKANLSMTAGKSKGKDKAIADVRTSDDVGNYVCGFVYYASLEWFWKKYGPQGERKVLFFHVPNMHGGDDYERGKYVAITLIEAVISSCGM